MITKLLMFFSLMAGLAAAQTTYDIGGFCTNMVVCTLHESTGTPYQTAYLTWFVSGSTNYVRFFIYDGSTGTNVYDSGYVRPSGMSPAPAPTTGAFTISFTGVDAILNCVTYPPSGRAGPRWGCVGVVTTP